MENLKISQNLIKHISTNFFSFVAKSHQSHYLFWLVLKKIWNKFLETNKKNTLIGTKTHEHTYKHVYCTLWGPFMHRWRLLFIFFSFNYIVLIFDRILASFQHTSSTRLIHDDSADFQEFGPLKRFGEVICPHFIGWAELHKHFSTFDSIPHKKVPDIDVPCPPYAGRSSIIFQEDGTFVILKNNSRVKIPSLMY